MSDMLLIALALWMYDHAFIMKHYSCILKGRWHTWLRLAQLKYLMIIHLSELAEHPPYQIMLDPSLGQRLPKVEEIRLVKVESLKWRPFVLA